MIPQETAWRNVAIGSGLQLFEMSTFGIIFDNWKTMMAAHRNDTARAALVRIYQNAGVLGFYRGLIPWGWLEASTKGGVLFMSQNAVSSKLSSLGYSNEVSAACGGMAGGACQAYTVMGPATFFRTLEITRSSKRTESSLSTVLRVIRSEGVLGIYKGVHATAFRQSSNWAGRFGFSRIIERGLKGESKDRELTKLERLFASSLGGALSTWNQPLDVLRVVQQQQPTRISIPDAARRIYADTGYRGFFRGITPRMCLSVYLTVVMVFGGDEIKERLRNGGEIE